MDQNRRPDLSDERVRFDSQLQSYVKHEDDIDLLWDADKMAWFPMYNDDLLSQQQSAYAPAEASANTHNHQQKRKHASRTIKVSQSSVYVTGLPLDVSIDELKSYFSKCGLILPDPDSGKPKIKIYTGEQGQPKGDALVTFYKPESVDLALTLLDETAIRPEYVIRVQKADYSSRFGDASTTTNTATQGNPASTNKKPLSHKTDRKKLEAQLKHLDNLLDWNDAKLSKKLAKAQRTIIIKPMFHPSEFDQDPSYLLDLKESIRDECGKFGEVTNVHVYDRNPDGVVLVRFAQDSAARSCIEKMHGRFFAKKQLSAVIWDGETKYDVQTNVSEEEEQKRLEKYAQWLESGGLASEKTLTGTSDKTETASLAVVPSMDLLDKRQDKLEHVLVDEAVIDREREDSYLEAEISEDEAEIPTAEVDEERPTKRPRSSSPSK